MTQNVDEYFEMGCGRCPLGNTPQCKVHKWEKELALLRKIVLDCELTEEAKWGVPCYSFQKNNVAVVSAFNDYCAISFFKGSLLSDTHLILSKPSENFNAGRLIRFANIHEIIKIENILKAYIFEAIEVEKAGLKVNHEKIPEPIPVEFQKKLHENPDLKMAFEKLTSGRKRGYIIHFSQPKQSVTREARIEKFIPQILNGKGMND